MTPTSSTQPPSQSKRLEALLLGLVREGLGQSADPRIGDEQVMEILRSRLYSRELSAEESHLLQGGEGSIGVGYNRLVALRIERALCAANEAAARLAGVDAPEAPGVVVVQGKGDECVQTMGPAIEERVSMAPSQELKGHTLVLCDGEAFAEVSNTKSLRLDTVVIDVSVLADDERVGDGDAGAIVKEVDAGLAEVRGVVDELVDSALGEPRPAEDDAPDLVGTLIGGKYLAVRLVGRGGFGAVYEARDQLLKTPVAIKVLNPEVAKTRRNFSAFKAEARRVTRLSHPNIVDWKSFDQMADGTLYFVMELLRGEELAQVIKREGRLPVARAKRIMTQILDALLAAHHLEDGQSIVHLDLKPQNVFVLPGRKKDHSDEWIKVIDFGISQFLGKEELSYESGSTSMEEGRSITRCMSCTPEYASPEQAAHVLGLRGIEPLDMRSDLYSFGVMAFHMLTGELPFEKPKHRLDFLDLHRNATPRRVRDVNWRVPRRLAAFVDRCLRRKPDERWANTQEAHEALTRICKPTAGYKWSVAAPLLAGVAVMAAYQIWGPSVGATSRPLQVQMNTDDGWRTVSREQKLYFGPHRSRQSFKVTTEAAFEAPAIRILSESTKDVLQGWEAELVGDLGDIVALDGAETGLGIIQLSEGVSVESDPIEFVYINTEDWRLEMDVPGKGLKVDPMGQQLEIRAVARDALVDENYLDRIEVHVNGESKGDRWEESGRGEFKIDLEDLGLVSGEYEVSATGWDLAGGTNLASATLEVEPEELKFARVFLEDAPPQRSDTVYVLTDQARISAAVNLAADWTVSVLVDGSVIDEKTLPHAKGLLGEAFSVRPPDRDGMEDCEGIIRIKVDDNAYVARADDARGRKDEDIRFLSTLKEIDFRAMVKTRGSSEEELERDFITHFDETHLLLRPQRMHSFDIRFTVSVFGPDGPFPDQIIELPKLELERTHNLSLLKDGVYGVRVTAQRVEGNNVIREPKQLNGRIIRDTSGPRVAIAAPGFVITPGSSPPAMVLTITDEPLEEYQGTPVDLKWSLTGPSKRNTPVDPPFGEEGLLPREYTFFLPEEWAEEFAEEDGRWLLQVEGKDDAGNRADPVRPLEWEVALHGPKLEVHKPSNTSSEFSVRVDASDRNGVKRITASLVASDPVVLRRTLELERDEENEQTWRSKSNLGQEWSGQKYTLIVEAFDEYENSRTARREMETIEEFETEYPPEIDRKGPMRLVRGTAKTTYVALGRVGDDQAELRRAGVMIHDPWSIGYDSIQAYYVDKYEVSRRQYREFVVDGYFDQSHWPQGEVPDEHRRRELLDELGAARSLDLPMTNIKWAEAAAYAHWAGKRLPSVVEWEFALRDGTRYIVHPGARKEGPAVINYGKPTGGPWGPGEEKDDVTDAGICFLAANVSEWTATPFRHPAPGAERRHVEKHPLDYLVSPDPTLREPDLEYYVMGGSFESDTCTFLERYPRRRSLSKGSLGFRCALSAPD